MAASEKELLEKAQAGDREALSQLLMAHERACYDLALCLTGNAADAEDVCQDAFLRAAKDLAAVCDVRHPRSWLLRIVVCAHRNRLVSDAARRRRERSYAMALETTTSPDRRGASEREAELSRHLDDSLRQIREDYRLPIVLHYRQGLSYPEAAAVMDLPEGTVATNIRRGLDELRGLMTKAGYGAAAVGAGAVEGALAQAPAASVPASLTAFIKSLVPAAAAVKTAGAATATATAAGRPGLRWDKSAARSRRLSSERR